MLIHNVYFWLKEGVTEGQRSEFEKGMQDLAAAVPEVAQSAIGRPASTPGREVVDNSFGHSLFLWFNSVEDHNTYQDHAEHHSFVDKFKGLWEKVLVRDSNLA